MTTKASYLYHEPCPKCSSRDALARYSDGSAYCFAWGCGHHEKGDEEFTPNQVSSPKQNFRAVHGDYKALPARGISEDTCRFWGYQVGRAYNPNSEADEPCHIANYYDENKKLICQHLRFQDKNFSLIKIDGVADFLYGKHLWFNKQSKIAVITEGQIDALSVSEVQGNKYPVFSVPSGVSSAAKVIAKELPWLEENYEKIVLMFDNDEVGKAAAEECAQLFSPNKCAIASLPEKDANDMLKKGRVEELIKAIWQAKTYRPESVVSGEDVWDLIINPKANYSALYPYSGLNTKLIGLRAKELVVITAGSGVGKSAFCREITYSLLQQGDKVGIIALEEDVRRSALGLMSIEANRPLHVNDGGMSLEDLRKLYDNTIGDDKVVFYNHFGSLESERLLKHIRWMAKGAGVKWVLLDHVSIAVSGLADGDERRIIDNLMTNLRSLVEETGVGLLLISHLRRPEGKGHEEGAKVSMSQLRGSGSIAQLADVIIALERDTQAEGDKSHITTVRVLKNRFIGDVGVAGQLEYNPEICRLLELKFNPFDLE